MSRPLILMFVNSGYEDILQNWLVGVRRLGVKEFLVIALDRTLEKKLRQQGVPVKYQRCGPKQADLWILRVRVIRKFLKQGWDIIHSDADAVWLKNPIPLLANQTGDFVFSQGIDWPHDVYKRWGFVLCCGFFMARSNPRVIKFMRAWQKRVRQDKDDQVSFNRLLMESEVKWEVPPCAYELQHNGKALTCYREPVLGTNGDLTAALLPHCSVLRAEEDSSQAAVMHPHSPKNSAEIRTTLKERGCWFL